MKNNFPFISERFDESINKDRLVLDFNDFDNQPVDLYIPLMYRFEEREVQIC